MASSKPLLPPVSTGAPVESTSCSGSSGATRAKAASSICSRATTRSLRASAAATTPATRSRSASGSWRCASSPRARSCPRRKLHVGAGTVVALRRLLDELDALAETRRRRLADHGLRPRARRVSVSCGARPGRRSGARERCDRDDRPRDRSGLRRPDGARPGSPSATCAVRRSSPSKIPALARGQGAAARRSTGAAARRQRSSPRRSPSPSALARTSSTASTFINDALERGERHPGRGRAGHAAGRRTYGTYPYVTSSVTVAGRGLRRAWGRAARDRQHQRRREGVLHAGRRRAVPVGAARRDRRAAA